MEVRFFATATALIILSACASSPPQAAKPVQLAAATPYVAPPVAQPAAATTTATSDLSDVEHTRRLAKKARELSYHVEYKKGEPFYCHTSAQLGTRFETKACINEAEFEDVVRRSEQVSNIMNTQPACTGPSCMHN
jgi:hypothetical protein